MKKVVKFKLKQIPAALNEIYVRVTDLDRNLIFEGHESLISDDLELDLGSLGTIGQGVLIHGDGYIKNSNEETFKSFGGYSIIESLSAAVSTYVASLNGVGQVWKLSKQLIDIDNLDGLSLKGYFDNSDGIFFANSYNNYAPIKIYTESGSLSVQLGGDFTANITPVVTGYTEFKFTGTNTMEYIVDGISRKVVSLAKGSARGTGVTYIGGVERTNGEVTQPSSGVKKDIEISQSGVVLFNSSLTNKNTGAVQASTVGATTATLLNYDESVWVEFTPFEQYLSMNGSTQSWSFSEKLIDVNALDGTTIEFESISDDDGDLFGQFEDEADCEFRYFKENNLMVLRIGGENRLMTDSTCRGVHELAFSGGSVAITINGVSIYSGSYADGGAREPNAKTSIGQVLKRSGGVLNTKITKSGVVTYSNKMNARESYGTQNPDVGTAVATLSNYSPTVWENLYVTNSDIPTDKFVIFAGASIMQRSFDQPDRVEAAYLDKGLDITTFNRATGGDYSRDTYIKAISAVKEFSKVTKEGYVVGHTAGNDASFNGPYPGGIAAIETNIRGMVDIYRNAGYKIGMSPISYRVPPASNPTEPYNTNLVDGLVSTLADFTFDMHTFTLNAGDAYFGSGGGDGIHPSNPAGEVLTVNYVVDNTYQYIAAL